MVVIETGGKTVYGATLGILMLETQFPRIPGDIGNALTWPFPVQYRIVRGATPDNVVRGRCRGTAGGFHRGGPRSSGAWLRRDRHELRLSGAAAGPNGRGFGRAGCQFVADAGADGAPDAAA